MPIVSAPTRQMSNGDVITQFVDSVDTSAVTYTYVKTQEKFVVRNLGPKSLSVSVAAVTQVVLPGKLWERVADFTSFSVNGVGGITAFDAWSDEKGSTFESPEGKYFQSNGGSGGGTGGSGVVTYSTLSELQAALPNGSNAPVWVIEDNSWYYWSGMVTSDVTAPTISASPVPGTFAVSQSVTLTANESATIYYTIDGSTPTISSAVYSSPISIASTKTIKAIAKDAAGNITNPAVTFAYTIDAAAPDTTPPTVNVSPASGTYTATQSVTLTSEAGATIYYTLNGSTPTVGSTVYSGPISVSATTTLKYFGKDTAGNSSTVQTATYTISAPSSYVTSGLTHQLDNLTTNSTVADDGTYIPTTGDFTLYFVFKHSPYQNFMEKYELGVPTNSQYRIYEEDFGGFTLSANFWDSGGGQVVRGTTDISSLSTSVWAHGAVVRSGNTVKVYTNNVLEGTGTLSVSTMNTSNKQIRIGNAATNTKAIYLYNRALTTGELTQNFNNL